MIEYDLLQSSMGEEVLKMGIEPFDVIISNWESVTMTIELVNE